MYAPHQGGQSLRIEVVAPDVQYQRDGQPASFWGLNGSASRKGDIVTVTMVNPALSNLLDTQVALRGATIMRAMGTVLAASDMHAHNTFDQPNAVKSAPLNATISQGGMVSVTMPPASVVKLELSL
jgi:alpha-N-arabinofuranosidase